MVNGGVRFWSVMAILASLIMSGTSVWPVAAQERDDQQAQENEAAGGDAQDVEAEADADTEAEAEPEKADRIPEFDDASSAVAVARDVFEASVKAYQKGLPIRDTAEVVSISTYAGHTDEQKFDVPMLLSDDALKLTLNGVTFTVVDGTIYGESQAEPNRLYIQDFRGPISAELFVDVLYIFPFVHIPMMYSDDPLNDLFVATIEPTIAAHRRIYLAEPDREFDEILIESAGEGAPVELRFDPETHLIVQFRTELRDPNINEMDGTEITVNFSPETLEVFPIEELVVETEKRRMVDSIVGLYAPPNVMDLMNKPSPGFDLPNLVGEPVKSDDMIGNVIVLAFWQIQHEGLLPVLPALQELTEWRDEEGKSIEIVTVNAGDPLDRLRTYWNDHEYNMLLLRDEDFTSVNDDFRIPSFPTVIIIAADGTVHMVHPDFEFGADIAEILKNDVMSAFARDI